MFRASASTSVAGGGARGQSDPDIRSEAAIQAIAGEAQGGESFANISPVNVAQGRSRTGVEPAGEGTTLDSQNGSLVDIVDANTAHTEAGATLSTAEQGEMAAHSGGDAGGAALSTAANYEVTLSTADNGTGTFASPTNKTMYGDAAGVGVSPPNSRAPTSATDIAANHDLRPVRRADSPVVSMSLQAQEARVVTATNTNAADAEGGDDVDDGEEVVTAASTCDSNNEKEQHASTPKPRITRATASSPHTGSAKTPTKRKRKGPDESSTPKKKDKGLNLRGGAGGDEITEVEEFDGKKTITKNVIIVRSGTTTNASR